MSRHAPIITCAPEVEAQLNKLACSTVAEHRLVQRARLVLGCLHGKGVKEIAAENQTSDQQVLKWRQRFCAGGIAALTDAPRSGKPKTYGAEFRKKVLARLQEPPPHGLARWDCPTLARDLKTSKNAITRLLRREGIGLARLRTWCVSTDPEFGPKAADIVGLYLNPPENAVVISIDEKPSIQALGQRTGYVKASDGKTVRALGSTYKRHGTLNLYAALVVATGAIKHQTTARKTRGDFQAFLDTVVKDFPPTRELHVIIDNYSPHKNNGEWLARHPNVHFHYTPTGASWLNQVEIWFGILGRKVLRGASFSSTENLAQALKDYITAYNKTAHPFVWTKPEVRGTQIRNTLSNLRL
jgi:transposase